MARVHRALIFAAGLLAAAPLPSGRACDRTSWVYDPVDLPACVDVSYVTVGNFEFANGCSEALTLSAPDCDHCTVPSAIPPGGSGVLTLDPEPTREDDGVVDLAWDVAATNGTLAFTFPVNACPDDNGCVAAPVAPRGAPQALLAALALTVVWRRRRRP